MALDAENRKEFDAMEKHERQTPRDGDAVAVGVCGRTNVGKKKSVGNRSPVRQESFCAWLHRGTLI